MTTEEVRSEEGGGGRAAGQTHHAALSAGNIHRSICVQSQGRCLNPRRPRQPPVGAGVLCVTHTPSTALNTAPSRRPGPAGTASRGSRPGGQTPGQRRRLRRGRRRQQGGQQQGPRRRQPGRQLEVRCCWGRPACHAWGVRRCVRHADGQGGEGPKGIRGRRSRHEQQAWGAERGGEDCCSSVCPSSVDCIAWMVISPCVWLSGGLLIACCECCSDHTRILGSIKA